MAEPGDFVQRLRMNNIFPTGNYNPFSAPQLGNAPDINGMLNAVSNYRDRQRILDQQEKDNEYFRARTDRMIDQNTQNARAREQAGNAGGGLNGMGMLGGNVPAGMNVVYGGESGSNAQRLGGKTLDQAEAERYDPYFGTGGAKVADRYIPEQTPQEKLFDVMQLQNQQLAGQRGNILATNANQIAMENLRSQNRIKEEGVKGEQDRQTKMSGAGTIGMIPDPDDPSKQISVVVKPDGSIRRATLDDQQAGVFQKPGGPPKPPTAAELKAQNEQKAHDESVRSMAQETLNSINDVLDVDTKGNATLKPGAATAVGLSKYFGEPLKGRLPAWVPGTEAREANDKLQRISSEQVLNLVNQMKSASGSGFAGIRNRAEFETLANSASILKDTGLSDAAYARELKRIRDAVTKIVQPEVGRTSTNNSQKRSPADNYSHYGDDNYSPRR